MLYFIGSQVVNTFSQNVSEAGREKWEELSIGLTVKEAVDIEVICENTSNVPVFFDEISVKVQSVPTTILVQENHYYPFGLGMRGLDWTLTPNRENKYQYNGGVEKNTDFDLNWYETLYRDYDLQTSRFVQVDPRSEDGNQENLTPYHYSFNNPIRYNDPKGDCPDGNCGDWLLGATAALVDNLMFAGVSPVRSMVAKHISGDGRAFNEGQNVGDVASVVVGGAIAGGGAVGGAVLAPVTLGGSVAGGAAVVGRGAVVAGAGVINLASQKGRVNVNSTNNGGNNNQSGENNTNIPTTKEKALQIKNDLNGGRNSVTIKTSGGQIRYDLDGLPHGGVETPHIQAYKNNYVNGVVRSVSRVKKQADAATHQDLRLLVKYFKSLPRQ